MPLIDSHVHLDFAAFDADRAGVVARARAAGVVQMVVPGVVASDWPRVAAVVNANAGVFACYGLHPCFVSQHREADLDELAQWVLRERPVAVGECGLDFFGSFRDSEKRQRQLFESQLSLAVACDLPVVLHARRSVDDVLKMLRQSGVERGVLHSFSGSEQQAFKAIDQGLYIGVGGSITHARASKARAVASTLPLSLMMPAILCQDPLGLAASVASPSAST